RRLHLRGVRADVPQRGLRAQRNPSTAGHDRASDNLTQVGAPRRLIICSGRPLSLERIASKANHRRHRKAEGRRQTVERISRTVVKAQPSASCLLPSAFFRPPCLRWLMPLPYAQLKIAIVPRILPVFPCLAGGGC